MQLRKLPYRLSVAKYEKVPDGITGFFSLSSTREEISLVCETERLPQGFLTCEDGWRALVVEGQLDFSLVGILSALTGILAQAKIPLFAISTFDTDYLLVKEANFADAIAALKEKGYTIL